MATKDAYPELVEMIRVLYEEVTAHQRDYHHTTPREVLERVREFLVAVDETGNDSGDEEEKGEST